MAFNIMNVSNIEVASKVGYTSLNDGWIILIDAPPANSIYKIKTGKFIGNTGFEIKYANKSNQQLYATSHQWSQEKPYITVENYLLDFYMTEGNNLQIRTTGYSNLNYIITYEIWT